MSGADLVRSRGGGNEAGSPRSLRRSKPVQVPRVCLNPRSRDTPGGRDDYTPRVTNATTVGRAALLALLAWWTVRFVPHPLDAGRVIDSFLHLINLPFHEAGHIVFIPLGEFMTILGGSLFQIIIPIVCAVAFARRDDWFGMSVCLWWAGENLVDLGPYIADARALQLPLIGGQTGAEVYGHDWEAILEMLGWLHLDHKIGMGAHIAGSVIMIASLGLGGWCLWIPDSPEQAEA